MEIVIEFGFDYNLNLCFDFVYLRDNNYSGFYKEVLYNFDFWDSIIELVFVYLLIPNAQLGSEIEGYSDFEKFDFLLVLEVENQSLYKEKEFDIFYWEFAGINYC